MLLSIECCHNDADHVFRFSKNENGSWSATCVVQNSTLFSNGAIDLSLISPDQPPTERQVRLLLECPYELLDDEDNDEIITLEFDIAILNKSLAIVLTKEKSDLEKLRIECSQLQDRVKQLEEELATATRSLARAEQVQRSRSSRICERTGLVG